MGLRGNEGRDAFRDLHAEAAVLGAIMMSNELIPIAAERLTPGHFFRDAHGEIFGAMLSLWDRKRAIDPFTVIDALGKRADAVGGAAYVSSLIDGLPRVRNIDQYVAIVYDRATRRELSKAVNAAKEAVEDGSVTLLEASETITGLVQRHVPKPSLLYPASYASMFRAWVDNDDDREASRIFTGIAPLDLIHKGGLPSGGVTVLGGRTSHGKTALALSIAHHVGVGEFAEPVLFVSGEMDPREMTARLTALHGRLDAEALIAGTLEYIARRDLERSIDEIEQLSKITFLCKKLTPSQIRAAALRQKAEYGIAFLVIDYIGIMRADPKMLKNAGFKRNEVLGDMMKAYKEIGEELQIPVLTLAQLQRGAVARKEPTTEDLKESGNLEEDAHVVWLLNRPPGKADGQVIVAKNRNGRVGRADVFFDQGCMRYSGADGAMAAAARSAASGSHDEGEQY